MAQPKAKIVGIFEAKTNLSEIIAQVERGRVYRITKRGKPVAELRAISDKRKPLERGCAKNDGYWMAPDFDETPADFAEYV